MNNFVEDDVQHNNTCEKTEKMGFSDSDEEITNQIVSRIEGYLYIFTKSKKVKKLWFKLINRDLHCIRQINLF